MVRKNAQAQTFILTGPCLLQEEAMEIAKRLEKEELTDFVASNGWSEKWKQTYGKKD